MADECKATSCPYEAIIDELKRDAERNSEQHREFYDKFNNHATAIAISEERYANLLNAISRLENSIVSIGNSLEEIKQKPSKRWDSVITTALGCVVTAVVVYMLSHLGL